MRRVYLDNAATSYPKPPEIWDAVLKAGRDDGANAGRSSYRTAEAAGGVLDDARVRLARLLGGEPNRVVLTLNATDALNIALKGFLRPDDHVITSIMEHNSVRRPLAGLERERRVRVTEVPADRLGRIDPDAVRRAVTPGTRMVALVHASNVCGTIQPVETVGQICREHGIALLVDAAQTAGSLDIDMKALGIGLLAVPGHKGLLGPLGTGALLLAPEIELTPWREGGTGSLSTDRNQPTTLPERLEAGSPNVPGIAGLAAGLRHLETIGLAAIRQRLRTLSDRLYARLVEIPGIELGGDPDLDAREAIFPVRLAGYRPDELGILLDSAYGVEVRSGLHCAPGAHEALGTFPEGSVRISPGPFTTEGEVDAVAAALEDLAGGLG